MNVVQSMPVNGRLFRAAPGTVANALVHFKGQWLHYYGTADRHDGLATCRSAIVHGNTEGKPNQIGARGMVSKDGGKTWGQQYNMLGRLGWLSGSR